jgi:hypothetical protein
MEPDELRELVPGEYDNKGSMRDDIAQLELTASTRDARAFEKTLEAINWQDRLSSDFIRAIQLALRMGAYTGARRIADLGRKCYPNNEEIRKYAIITAPPTVTSQRVRFDPSIRANRDWLKTHGDEYRGKWLGLRSGELVGSADSVDGLMELVGDDKDVLITRVY